MQTKEPKVLEEQAVLFRARTQIWETLLKVAMEALEGNGYCQGGLSFTSSFSVVVSVPWNLSNAGKVAGQKLYRR